MKNYIRPYKNSKMLMAGLGCAAGVAVGSTSLVIMPLSVMLCTWAMPSTVAAYVFPTMIWATVCLGLGSAIYRLHNVMITVAEGLWLLFGFSVAFWCIASAAHHFMLG